MSRDDEEPFLSRWSRRKRTGPEPEAKPAPAPEPEMSAPPPAEVAENEDEDEAAVLERLGLPDPDTLEQGADFTVYLRAAVPEALRRRALRRLWRSNPALAVLDGLNDYDDDYTGGFVKPGVLKTAYKVGRGFLERVPDADDAETPDTGPEDATGADDPAPVAASLRLPDEPRPPAAPEAADDDGEVDGGDVSHETALDDEDAETAGPEAPSRRRMAFRFPEDG